MPLHTRENDRWRPAFALMITSHTYAYAYRARAHARRHGSRGIAVQYAHAHAEAWAGLSLSLSLSLMQTDHACMRTPCTLWRLLCLNGRLLLLGNDKRTFERCSVERG